MNLKKENAWNMQIVIKYADKKIDSYILEQFNKEVVSFGRQPDNDIILDLDFISRIHGVFFMDAKYWNREYRNAMISMHIGRPIMGQRVVEREC